MRKLFFIAFMLSIGFSLNAKIVEPSLCPGWCSLKSDKPFVMPLEDVSINFNCPIKLMDTQKVEVLCEGETVAESLSLNVINDKEITGWDGTLVAHFDSRLLPKGKSYKLVVHEGTVGWTESYNDIQVVNMENEHTFFVPATLGEPEIFADTRISDSRTITGISYLYETATVGDACFELYREDEKIGEYLLEITNWSTPLSIIHPDYNEFIPFEQNVRYSLVLPAGSLSSIYRDDITNEEVKIDFVGCYVDPSLPFSYIWCSRYTDHSNVMGEVTFTYDRPIALTDEAKVQLWEGDGEILVKEVIPWINTDVNCWMLVADFGGIPLTSEKGYTLVIPDGALISTDEISVKSSRSELSIGGNAGIDNIIVNQSPSNSPVYDLFGRKVDKPISGSIYIQDGKKIIYGN